MIVHNIFKKHARKNQKEFKLDLNEIRKENHKSVQQKKCIKNIKMFYKAQEEFVNIFMIIL